MASWKTHANKRRSQTDWESHGPRRVNKRLMLIEKGYRGIISPEGFFGNATGYSYSVLKEPSAKE